MKIILVTSLLIMLSIAGCGERYQYRSAMRGGLYKIDRFTGDVWLIYGTKQMKVEKTEPIDPKDITWDKPNIKDLVVDPPK